MVRHRSVDSLASDPPAVESPQKFFLRLKQKIQQQLQKGTFSGTVGSRLPCRGQFLSGGYFIWLEECGIFCSLSHLFLVEKAENGEKTCFSQLKFFSHIQLFQ